MELPGKMWFLFCDSKYNFNQGRTFKMLYKFVRGEIAAKVLKERKVRFTPAWLLNDPFECSPYISTSPLYPELITPPPPVNPRGFIGLHATVEARKAFEESLDRGGPEKRSAIEQSLGMLVPKILKAIFSTTLIFSLTESPENLLMWSHYAENHKGAVIGFNARSSFLSSTRDGKTIPLAYKVTYSRKRPQSRNFTEVTQKAAYLTKSVDWAYETEWRRMLNIDEADEEVGNFHFVHLPEDAISELILGAACPDQTKKDIFAAIDCHPANTTIRVINAQINERTYGINLVGLDGESHVFTGAK
jgi:hypothetical protein